MTVTYIEEKIEEEVTKYLAKKPKVQTGWVCYVRYHPDVTRALAALTQTRATLWGTNR